MTDELPDPEAPAPADAPAKADTDPPVLVVSEQPNRNCPSVASMTLTNQSQVRRILFSTKLVRLQDSVKETGRLLYPDEELILSD